MKLPKIMEEAVRKIAMVPADVPIDVIDISWDDHVYGDSWGCETCGYGKPDDELTVDITWSDAKGKTQRHTKTYTGWNRLADFFTDLEANS